MKLVLHLSHFNWPVPADGLSGRADGDDPRTTVERLARHVVPAAAELQARR